MDISIEDAFFCTTAAAAAAATYEQTLLEGDFVRVVSLSSLFVFIIFRGKKKNGTGYLMQI